APATASAPASTAGAPPSVPPPAVTGKTPPPIRMIPGRIPPPVVQPRGGVNRYSGPPSREVTQQPSVPPPAPQVNRPPMPGRAVVGVRPPEPQKNISTPQPEAPKAQIPEIKAPQRPTVSEAPSVPPVVRAPNVPPPVSLRPPAIPQMPPRTPAQQQQPSRPPAISVPQVSAPPPPPPMPAAPAAQADSRAAQADSHAPTTPAMPAAAPTAHGSAGAEKKRVLVIKPPIVVRDFAIQIGRKPFQLISELMEMNIFASMNQALDIEVAKKIAAKQGIELDVRHRGEAQAQAQAEEKKKAKPVERKVTLEERPPVVCILGHVDHGKTTLLDTIRKTRVAAGEAGGITQHVGAYQVDHKGKKITFIDTPGHAAFFNMRARGANVTDIAVLVVAADDGFMPQTDEALGHARYARVPVVVAINKTDMPGADIDKVRRQLQERDLTPEEWGGETLAVPVSALKGNGITELLEAITLQAEVTEGIEADFKASPEGVVLEAQKEIGVGATASVIIEQGTLKRGDSLVCGPHYCRVRTLIDDCGKQIKQATPGMPVKVVGWTSTPEAGDSFHTVANERAAKEEAEENEHRLKLEQIAANEANQRQGKASIDDLFAAIAQSQSKCFRVVVKADVYGTAEALAVSLEQIKSEKIKLEVVDMGVGAVTKNDILMSSAAGAAIVAFNVNLENGVAPFAKHHSTRLFQHNIIYELIDQIKDAMADELPPELRENKIGAAEVRQVFPVAKSNVAGSMVTEGRVARSALARLLRKGQVVAEGKIATLRRFKDDASEVRAGYECGIQLDSTNNYQVGDIVECYEILKIKAAL
ncbi:MAG: translation initiation factor IF-2, partial [Opitutales bacterium]|nr:translation initiation factor IF-2 [Opitutales bacterium]